MEFSLSQDFPAGLDRLWAAFGRPDYPQRKYRALGATAVRLLRFHATASSIEVRLERDVPVDASALPAWARTLMPGEQTLRHRTSWRRLGPTQVSAELDLAPVGLPVHAHGIGNIVETAPGATRMVLHWQVTSTLPLLGRKVERLFAEQLRGALHADHVFTLQYLQQAAAD
jgi:hypothetical protein